MAENIDEVMKRLNLNTSQNSVKNTPPPTLKELPPTVSETVEDDFDDDGEDDDENEEEEIEDEKVEEKPKPVKKVKGKNKPQPKEEIKPQETAPNIDEVTLLQNDGVFRVELLHRLNQQNDYLRVIASCMAKAVGGENLKG